MTNYEQGLKSVYPDMPDEQQRALVSAIALITSLQILKLDHLLEDADRVFKYIQNTEV